MNETKKHDEIESLSSSIISNFNIKKKSKPNNSDEKIIGKREVEERKRQEKISYSMDQQYQSPIVRRTRDDARKTDEIINAISPKKQGVRTMKKKEDLKNHTPESISDDLKFDDVNVRIVDNYNVVGKPKYDIIPNYFSYDPAGLLSPIHKEYLAANQTLLYTFYKKVERYANAGDSVYGKMLKEFVIGYTKAQKDLNELYSNKGLIQLKRLEQNDVYAIFAKMVKHAKEARAEKLEKRSAA